MGSTEAGRVTRTNSQARTRPIDASAARAAAIGSVRRRQDVADTTVGSVAAERTSLPARTVRSANARSLADWNRPEGSFDRQRWTIASSAAEIGRSGPIDKGGG